MNLSIIIPIYNVENYIQRCAQSILSQTADSKNYEVIFVNDGTKDNSLLKLKEIIDFDKYPNYYLLSKTNGGLGSARNFGLKHSHGEYIWFVDSDDWIEPDSVKRILNYTKYNADIIVSSQMFKNTKSNQVLKYKKSRNFKGSGKKIMSLIDSACFQSFICQKNYILRNNFLFNENILHEDSELIPKMLYTAHNVVSFDQPIYHHYMREGSIIHIVNPHRIESMYVVLNSLCTFYNNQVKKEDHSVYACWCVMNILGLLKLSLSTNSDTKKQINQFFFQNRTLSEILRIGKYRQGKILGYLLLFFPKNAVGLYNFLKKVKF